MHWMWAMFSYWSSHGVQAADLPVHLLVHALQFDLWVIHCSMFLVTLCGSVVLLSSARISLPTFLSLSDGVVLCPVLEGFLVSLSCFHICILSCMAVVSVSLFVLMHRVVMVVGASISVSKVLQGLSGASIRVPFSASVSACSFSSCPLCAFTFASTVCAVLSCCAVMTASHSVLCGYLHRSFQRVPKVHLSRVDSTDALSIMMVRGLSFGFSLHAVRALIISGTNKPVLPCTLWNVCALGSVSPSLHAIPAPILVIHLPSPCIFLQLPSVATGVPFHRVYSASRLPSEKASNMSTRCLSEPGQSRARLPNPSLCHFPFLGLV